MAGYGVKKMANYKDHARDFFFFYSNYNFNNVISVFNGNACNLSDYMNSYRNYTPAPINIPGPVNQEKTCDKVTAKDKDAFVKICQGSASLLANNNIR